MSAHEYTPEQALEVLMKKLGGQDKELTAHVQIAIDAGKDVSETEPATDIFVNQIKGELKKMTAA